MKIKVLLPVDRLGLLEYHVDPATQTFYQVTYDALKKYNIDIHQSIIKDRFNQQYSPIKTFAEQNMYPGITLELHPAPKTDDVDVRIVMKDQEKMYVKVKLNLNFCGRQPLICDTTIYTRVETLMKQNDIPVPNNLLVQFGDKLFPPSCTLRDIGVFRNTQLFFKLEATDECPEQEILEAPEQQSAEISRLPIYEADDIQEISGQQALQPLNPELTSEDLAYFKSQKEQWILETGANQMTTPEQRMQLRNQRQNQLELKSDAKTQHLFQEIGMMLIQRFSAICTPEQLASLQMGGYRLRRGRCGQPIFADEFSLFDLFAEADGLVDLELDEPFSELAQQLFQQEGAIAVDDKQAFVGPSRRL